MINLTPKNILRYDYGSYKGYFAENFVLQELFSYGTDTTVSWSGRTSEIEFILEIDGNIISFEVKSGINTKAKSLIAFRNGDEITSSTHLKNRLYLRVSFERQSVYSKFWNCFHQNIKKC